ncbi:vacuolar iron transporter homolog 1-like [Arachis stenosperma]|uniref:vacuolar iron transporter homolog 1-like n=1 Tax=Arachis stenosperma TaxID=217475 RepID=UPI0025ABF744|nr:vacuolar iron transporter homolog 1-like [Arachis stenosperma]
MAFNHSNNNNHSSPVNNETKFVVSDLEQQQQLSRTPENEEEANKEEEFDYSKRSQWLRAAVLGANDGLVSTAALMMGVGAVREDMKAMVLSGFAGLVAGACSMAIGEFVSVYSQLDIEIAQMKRQQQEDEKEKESLPNPLQAAAASAFAFSVGAMVPLLAASFVRDYKLRLGLILGSVSFALILFGCLAATLGKAPPFRSCVRVFFGGWLAMAITFGLTKLIGSSVL